MPAISVIIPVYNKIRYLRSLLEQLRAQTFADYECLLIDDGSTDGSGQVCDEFAAQDSRLRVFHIPNGGVSHARNLGLDHACGDYVTFIDGDDRIREDLLQNLYGSAKSSDADFVIGNLQKVWDGREETAVLPMPYQGLTPMTKLLPEFAQVQKEVGIYGFCAAKLIRREIIGTVRFDPAIRLAEDLSFYLDLYPKVDALYFDPTPCYSYLQAAENSAMLDEDEKIDYFTQLIIQLKIVNFLKAKEAFIGENRDILIRRLYDYVYYSLFHCKTHALKQMCAKIRSLDLPDRLPEAEEAAFRKLILFFFVRKWDLPMRAALNLYRGLKRIKRCFF